MAKWDNSLKNEQQTINVSVISGATQSILSRTEAKNYLKLDSDLTDDDNLVDSLISASQNIIEETLGGLSLYEKTIQQSQQGGCHAIELMYEPVIGTPTVSYYEDFDTVTASNITFSTHFRNVGSKLYHVDGYWDRGRDGDGYVITYNTGLFTASNVTNSNDNRLQVFKTAMLRLIARMYEQREDQATNVKEGNWSVSYDDKDMYDIKKLIMPFHTGRGLI